MSGADTRKSGLAGSNKELATLLRTTTWGTSSLEEAARNLTVTLRGFKDAKLQKRLGFVAGIRESDGPELAELNSKRLERYTAALRIAKPFPLFSCMDIYDSDFLARFDAIKSPGAWNGFWRRIFESKTITDLYLTPRWEASYGTLFETGLALELRMHVHLVDRNSAMLEILRTD